VEDLSIEKAVEILKGKHVSRRGRRPRKVAAEETGAESSNSSEISQRAGESSSSSSRDGSPTTVPRKQQSTESDPQGKQKRKYTRKSKLDPNSSESLPKDGSVDSSNGPDPVIKKRGRGRPRKNVAVSPELLVVQVLPSTPTTPILCFLLLCGIFFQKVNLTRNITS
jgi:hypothetical protein